MKKVKIMLTAVALFAVVGAALAFNAKYSTKFCTAALVNNVCPQDNICPNSFTGQVGTPGTKYCYRQTTGTCDQNTLCTTSDILTIEE
jgi:hypothetical protein